MNSPAFSTTHLTPAELHALNGRSVLVKSRHDHRNPPTAMRGCLEVSHADTESPTVSIAVEFPQMFCTSAHHRSVLLNDESLARLLASERDGTFEFTIDDELA